MQYLRLTWEDVEQGCREIAERIRGQGLEGHMLIGLSRGGLVPLRILSDLLGAGDVATMAVRFYRDIDVRDPSPEITTPLQRDVKGRGVILVDDISDTGGSLIAAKRHVLDKGAAQVTVATLAMKPHTKLVPDIYFLETPAWVIFPWEVQETIRLIAGRSAGRAEAEKELKGAGIKEEEYAEELKRRFKG